MPRSDSPSVGEIYFDDTISIFSDQISINGTNYWFIKYTIIVGSNIGKCRFGFIQQNPIGT